MSVLGIAFPLSLGADAPHSGSLELPWVYSFIFSGLSTSTALKAMAGIVSKKKTTNPTAVESLTKNYVFIAWTVFPMIALAWATLEDSLKEHALGVMWVAAFQFAGVAVAVRARGELP